MKSVSRIALALLLGCLTGGGAAAKSLQVVGPWEIAGMDPAQSGYIFSRTTETSGALKPGLADSWSASEDGLVSRFVLREGARFHDGSPVTAEAAAASLKRAYAGVGPLGQAPIAEISAEGAAVVVRLETPFAPLPAYLVHFSTIILAPSSYDEAGRVTRIVGSGPYKVGKLTPPLKMELEDLARLHGRPWSRVEASMARLRLGEKLLDRRPGEISGGELQRFALLRALLLDPVFLFADEATSRLDPVSQKETADLLKAIVAETGLSLLMVTHDPVMARKLSTRILNLEAAPPSGSRSFSMESVA